MTPTTRHSAVAVLSAALLYGTFAWSGCSAFSDGGGGSGQCGCPCACFFIMPTFRCPPAETPTLSLTGPCMQSGTENIPDAASIPIFSATAAGTCKATLTLASGETYSNEFTFTGQWFACGSNPHGCGEDFETDGGSSSWDIDNTCVSDSEPDAMPDAPSGDAADGP